jgi:2-polyprenyl-6-methoxyphenol hydroxylase-like FAD-dependent oxidoreductase
MRTLIAGAGVGGLTAAVALGGAGFEVTICEQMAEAGNSLVGGGFHLWPNAARALREVGLDEQARELGAPLERTEFQSWRGRRLAVWPIAELARRAGGYDVGISRQDLMSLLYATVDPAAVTSGAKVAGFAEREDSVSVQLDDGRELEGDVLVGADGLRSTVRAKLLGPDQPDYAGYVQWQTLVSGASDLFPAGTERITFGPGARTVMHHVGGDRLFWACVLYCPADQAGRQPGRKAMLLERFAGWPQPIEAAVEATPEEEIVGLPIFDRKPVTTWGRGRITLLGDAAHAMTTNTSQGGNQAIEDGVVLARMLSRESSPVTALRAYETRRIERTTPLVKNSRWISNVNAWRDPVRVGVRDRFFSIGLPRKGLSDLSQAVCEPL